MFFLQRIKLPIRIIDPVIYSFSSSEFPHVNYKKNVSSFFNKLINSASQDPWTPNNQLYELLDETFPAHVKKERKKLFGQAMLASTACVVIHLHVNPILTAIPLIFALKYTSLFFFMRRISTRLVKKIELVDKENIEIQKCFSEKTEKIIIKSLEINDINIFKKSIWEITFKNINKDDYYLIDFGCLSHTYKRENYLLLIQKNPANIPVGKLQVLKTIFSEATGLSQEEVFNFMNQSKDS